VQVFVAGDDHLMTRFGGRRLKSAKARNRGGEWYDSPLEPWPGGAGERARLKSQALLPREQRLGALEGILSLLVNGNDGSNPAGKGGEHHDLERTEC
jgi:hypothetical protein